MILVGSQRGGASQLAAHLMNDRDNDHVTIEELRGFVADDLRGALNERTPSPRVRNAASSCFPSVSTRRRMRKSASTRYATRPTARKKSLALPTSRAPSSSMRRTAGGTPMWFGRASARKK